MSGAAARTGDFKKNKKLKNNTRKEQRCNKDYTKNKTRKMREFNQNRKQICKGIFKIGYCVIQKKVLTGVNMYIKV